MDNSPAISMQVGYILVNDEDFETTLEVYNYTDSSFAISVSEHFGKAFREKLKEIGGIYKPSLNRAPHKGWIFSRGKYGSLQELVKKILSKEVKGLVPVEYKKKNTEMLSDGPLGPLPSLPGIVNSYKLFVEKSTPEFSNEVQMFVEGSNRYIWGPSEAVDKMLEELKLFAMMTFNNLSHKIVIAK
jgi:hypothetical protein